MKKIIFLGCENSHSAQFLGFIKDNPKYADLQVLGVYSHDEQASEKLKEKFGVPVLSSYSDFAGEADGVIITARDGVNHLKYAIPHMRKNVTMFVDKPITVSQEDAVELVRLSRQNGVKLCGGSSLRLDKDFMQLSSDSVNCVEGKTVGGYVRCPLLSKNVNSGFFFYAQHLVEVVMNIFGMNPISVLANRMGSNVYVTFFYGEFQVAAHYTDDNHSVYYAMRMAENGLQSKRIVLTESNCFADEFDEFYQILKGKQQPCDVKQFITPVYVMNAINRSLTSGKKEIVDTVII